MILIPASEEKMHRALCYFFPEDNHWGGKKCIRNSANVKISQTLRHCILFKDRLLLPHIHKILILSSLHTLPVLPVLIVFLEVQLDKKSSFTSHDISVYLPLKFIFSQYNDISRITRWKLIDELIYVWTSADSVHHLQCNDQTAFTHTDIFQIWSMKQSLSRYDLPSWPSLSSLIRLRRTSWASVNTVPLVVTFLSCWPQNVGPPVSSLATRAGRWHQLAAPGNIQ